MGAVDTLWVRTRATGRGAAIVGIAGAVALGGFGLLLGTGLCDAAGGCREETSRLVLVGGAVGGGAGARIGAGLGSLVWRWERRFP